MTNTFLIQITEHKGENRMNTNFYKLDLHIHTPASQCYEGTKNDDEYFEILRVARKQDLDIIAITDHNTIAGYERLLFLKKELENRKNILVEFKDTTTQVNDALIECDEKLSLFNDILIIPGIEITLNPGVHMLVLASPDKLDLLSQLLDSIGYTCDKRGNDCDIEINIDIKNFLTDAFLNGLVVIAPHIDSNKGIYNSLSGQFRGEIMRSPIITAFSCNSQSQKEKIISLFKSEPAYRRDTIPAFINCSDSHKTEEIGKKFSYIKLPSLSFENLHSALLTPEGKISDTSDQRLEKNILKLIEDESPILISDSSLMNVEDLSHYICAGLNEDINYILIGVTDKKKITGIKKELCDYEKLVSDSIDLLDSQYFQLRYSTTVETLGNGNNVVIIYMESAIECLWYTKENQIVYILTDEKPTPASIKQIESLVQENILYELGKLEQKNKQTAASIRTQLLSLTNTIEKHELIQDIMLFGIPLLSIYNLSAHASSIITEECADKYFFDNGQANGNVYFITKNPARLPDAILRYSCPSTNIPADVLDSINTVELDSNSIVLSEQGGTHIATQKQKIAGKNTNYLILNPIEDETLSPYAILAWLKSSLFTWYVYTKYNTTNIYLPEVMREIVIPYGALMDITDEIENIIQEIICAEADFLTNSAKENACQKCKVCTDNDCLIVTMLKKHNELISHKTALIDQLIFKVFCIDEEKQAFIKEDLEAAGIFNII